MALSDSWISAAAGLVGALIGGFSTYLANRAQWRRESRTTVYANLISAAYGMESFIRSGLENAEGPRTGTSTDTDPRTQFSLRLDTATLLAKGETREELDKWRDLLPRVLKEDDREGLLTDWQKQRNRFYDYARGELGGPGTVRDRNRAAWCSVAALPTTMAFVVPLAIPASADTVQSLRNVGHVFFAITFVLLLLASRAVSKWRKKLISLDGSTDELKANRNLSIAILLAFVLSLIAFILKGSVATFALGFFADLILIVGLFLAFGDTS